MIWYWWFDSIIGSYEGGIVIFTACVSCGDPFAVPLDESYLQHMEQGRQLVTQHTCERCGAINYVQHRRVGGETFGEDDERAKRIYT